MPNQETITVIPEANPTLGETPARLAKRELVKPSEWCPKPDIDFDPLCDPDNPKTIIIKDICKATAFIAQEIPKTPLTRSKCCVQFGMELYYKYEIFHTTGSFHERAAFFALSMLNEEQRAGGVYTASTGNWAKALAYYGQKMKISITVVLPLGAGRKLIEKCQCDFGASVVLYGKNLIEAKKHAYTLIAEYGKGIYINGYDHPNVIAALGSIGIELLEQLPNADAIVLPVGGGALIAGVATAIKQFKPGVLIYGVEHDRSCSFFKALENERPYQTAVANCLADSLAAPTAGFNAFHTARSLIDKMILVNDDWICRAILHLLEEEKLVTEGAGAAGLSALLAVPNILPELHGKNVVCVITGGSIDYLTLTWSLERAKAIEGRIIKLTLTLPRESTKKRLSILSIIKNVGGSILHSYNEKPWFYENDFETENWVLIIETRDLEHSCTLKRVLHKIFPGVCEFLEEPFSPLPTCPCYPKREMI